MCVRARACVCIYRVKRDRRVSFATDKQDFKVASNLRVKAGLKSIIEACTLADPEKRPSAYKVVDMLKALNYGGAACCTIS
mmetsp:Transcript_9717/g.18644  ORF Transcript_9717/g.18644 Transcript_9717/m.18644 type:complete len:81 (+) Transcript_9717:598-840(+)